MWRQVCNLPEKWQVTNLPPQEDKGMSRSRSLVVDYLVYSLVRVLVAVIQLLPYRTGCQFAAGLAWLAYHVDKRHRLVAVENLRHAFPGRYSDAELDALVRAVYRHFCTLIIDII